MTASPEGGTLLIADLTGYTAYLARGELEHAPTIAGDLLETIVGRLEPPYRLAKFEGDAAFMFVEDGRADSSLLLDSIEASYVAFRRRLRSIEGATTCDCNACSQAPRLDLKFFVHHGRYVRGRIAGRDELAGSSIIVIHRLLKGTTAQAVHDDGRAMGFAVFTGEALDHLGLEREAMDFQPGRESIEELGEVDTYTMDLESRWQTETERRRMTIADDEALIDLGITVPAPPAAAWARLTAPNLRPTWEGSIAISESSPDGRRGIGTTSQCVTGRLATLEQIVDWQPYDHIGLRLAVPELGPVDATYDLEETDAGTTVRLRWAAVGSVQPDTAAMEGIRQDKVAALDRLRAVLATGR